MLVETVLTNAVRSGTSILFPTMGEVLSERSGVINLGTEGCMLAGALTASGRTWHRPDRGVASRSADRVDQRVAHLDRQCVLRRRTSQHDVADAVDVGFDPQFGRRHDARFVRMFTTETPDPRPPALCWSA